MVYRTDADKIQELIYYHQRRMEECETKASTNRFYGNYDLAKCQEDEADNHRNMVAHYQSLLAEV